MCLTNMTLLHNENKIFIIDKDDDINQLKVIDTSGNFIRKISLNNDKNDLKIKVDAMCYIQNKLCIADNVNKLIYVFSHDESGNKRVYIELLNKFKIEENKHVFDITFSESNPNILYTTDTKLNEVSMWNIKTGKLFNSFHAISPTYIASKYNKILTISSILDSNSNILKTNFNLNKLNKTDCYNNCIYITDKYNFNKQTKIKFKNWLQPTGLYIDQNDHIYTIGYKLEEQATSLSLTCSRYQYLFIMDFNGNQLANIELTKITKFQSVLIFENRIYFTGVDKFKGIKIATVYYNKQLNEKIEKKNTKTSLTSNKSTQSTMSRRRYP